VSHGVEPKVDQQRALPWFGEGGDEEDAADDVFVMALLFFKPISKMR
jgi:hypothetical protein